MSAAPELSMAISVFKTSKNSSSSVFFSPSRLLSSHTCPFHRRLAQCSGLHLAGVSGWQLSTKGICLDGGSSPSPLCLGRATTTPHLADPKPSRMGACCQGFHLTQVTIKAPQCHPIHQYLIPPPPPHLNADVCKPPGNKNAKTKILSLQ